MVLIDANASALIKKLSHKGRTLAVAESLTAGMVCAHLASVPGASAVLSGGVVVYATDLKHTLAGVDEELLRQRGPVDPEVARQLARGVAHTCGADVGVGLTGVAGPDPQDGHPVGEVYVAAWVSAQALAKTRVPADIREPAGSSWVRTLTRGPWGPLEPAARRQAIRSAAVDAAVDLLVEVEPHIAVTAGNKSQALLR
ncbi:Putative competence-damage inducible protein [Corynebacterium heidelbergense]|nr:Putative competence-damage inducible protein [Corynebacterium heidelbergense]